MLNYEGLIFDIMGVAAEAVDPTGTNTTDIYIGGESVSSFLNKEKEVPYNWGIGSVTYITFLSAVFMGTIILEGVDTSLMAKVTPAALNETFNNRMVYLPLLSERSVASWGFHDYHRRARAQGRFHGLASATFFLMIPLVVIGYIYPCQAILEAVAVTSFVNSCLAK